MKKIVALLLVVCSVFIQSACGAADGPAHDVDAMIEAIGYVSLEKEPAIIAAEEAYNALSDAEKAQVKKYSQLSAARDALELRRIEAQTESSGGSLTGNWVKLNLYEAFMGLTFLDDSAFTLPETVFVLENNGVRILASGGTDQWSYQDGIVYAGYKDASKTAYKVVEVAGSQLLYLNDKNIFVKGNEYDAFMSAVFVETKLSAENVNQLFRIEQNKFDRLTEFGDVNWTLDGTFIINNVYQNGLVYFASKGLTVSILSSYGDKTISGVPYTVDLRIPENYCSLGSATGTIWYINNEFVQEEFVLNDNSLNMYHRSLSFFGGLFTWEDTSASYEELKPTDVLRY